MEIRENHKRAGVAKVFIRIAMVIAALSLISGYLQYQLLVMYPHGLIPDQAAEANQLRESLVTIAGSVVWLFSGIAFICWFRRAYYNLHQIVTNLQHGEGWAAGSWFIPILGIIRPYTIMLEMHKATARYLDSKRQFTVLKPFSMLLIIWWISYVGYSVFSAVVGSLMLDIVTMDDFINVTILDMISDVVLIASGFLALRVISNYANAEDVILRIADDSLVDGKLRDDIGLANTTI